MVLRALPQINWFAALDLQVAILQNCSKFLWLIMAECHFQYTTLSFGLFSVLQVLTKCMVMVTV